MAPNTLYLRKEKLQCDSFVEPAAFWNLSSNNVFKKTAKATQCSFQKEN